MRTCVARAWRALGAAAVVASALVCPAQAAPADPGIRLEAEAGLSGMGRSGRWVPVRVALTASDRDITGEVVVEWGDMRARRQVQMAAPSHASLEMYVRTVDARDAVTVRLVVDGRDVAALDAPIRMAPEEEPLVVCVGSALEAGAGCTVAMSPASLPRSPRGYAAADDVLWPSGAVAGLTSEQASALRRWRGYHATEREGLLATAPRPAFTAPAVGTPLGPTVAAGGTVLALVVAAAFWLSRQGPVWHGYAAVGAALVTGVAASVGAGRVGPGASVVVHHASVVQQVDDAGLLSMRGLVEYPAFDDYALSLSAPDVALTPWQPDLKEEWTTVSGHALRQGRFGQGHRERVELEGWVDIAPFDISRHDHAVRVSNRSNTSLTDCRFSEGFTPSRVGTLAPGATAEAHATDPTDGAFFACASPASPVTFEEPHYPVRAQGGTVVFVPLSDTFTSPRDTP